MYCTPTDSVTFEKIAMVLTHEKQYICYGSVYSARHQEGMSTGSTSILYTKYICVLTWVLSC